MPFGDDYAYLSAATSDVPDCLQDYPVFYTVWGPSFGGPHWISVHDDWDFFVGNDWMILAFSEINDEPTAYHGMGLALDRVRVGVPMETGVPDDGAVLVALGRPHPSPFTIETEIALSVPAWGRATVRVLDVAGRVVRTLIDRPMEPGEHVLSWDGMTDSGTRAASGIYFVRLEFAGRERGEDATRKVILLN
jgi:hypothetical protein